MLTEATEKWQRTRNCRRLLATTITLVFHTKSSKSRSFWDEECHSCAPEEFIFYLQYFFLQKKKRSHYPAYLSPWWGWWKKKNIYESVPKCKHMLLMLAEVKVLDNCVRTKKTRDGRQRDKYQIWSSSTSCRTNTACEALHLSGVKDRTLHW